MIPVGIDLSMRSVAAFTEDGLYKVKLKPGHERWEELTFLRYDLFDWLQSFDKPMVLFVEAAIEGRSKNVQTAIKIAMTAGAVCSLGYRSVLVPPSTWKMEVMGVGMGHASKEEIADWLNATHPGYSERCGADQDLRDAACIYLYGAKTLALGGRGDVRRPTRRARGTKALPVGNLTVAGVDGTSRVFGG